MILAITAGVSLLLMLPASVRAGGFRIMDQSASAAGQGSAFTAQADDPSAVYYNPAGMTQLRGVQTSIGAFFIGGSTSFSGASGSASGNFGNSFATPPPINIYATANLKDLGITALGDLSIGLGVLSPFGTSYQYPQNGPFAASVTQETLQLIDIKPTLAYKLNDQLSVGLGADIYTFSGLYGEGQYEYHLNNAGLAGAGVPAPQEISGKDTAAGFNASLLYTPFRNSDGKPLVNIGLIYRSQATLHLEGELRGNGAFVGNTGITVVLPQVYTAGIALWPVRDQEHEWKLELDLDYTGWKSVRNTDIHVTSGALAGTTISYPRNWKSTYTTMVGTEYKWLKPEVLPEWEVALRGGYWHSQTPVPDATFVPTVPDADNHSLSVGLGFLCKGKGKFLGFFECGSGSGRFSPSAIGLDIAYKAVIYETRTISGNTNPLGVFAGAAGAANGRYATTFHGGLVNLRVNF
jgi:long-chain fatty acid transport protein